MIGTKDRMSSTPVAWAWRLVMVEASNVLLVSGRWSTSNGVTRCHLMAAS
jgi:hypothetical protein